MNKKSARAHQGESFSDIGSPRRKSLRLSVLDEKNKKISKQQTEHQKTRIKNIIQPKCQQRRKKEASKKFTDFLSHDLNANKNPSKDINQQPDLPISECEIQQTNAAAEENVLVYSDKCYIKHASNGLRWGGRRLLSIDRRSTLKCWRLTSDSDPRKPPVYVFGMGRNGRERFVTYQDIGRPFTLERSDTSPTEIDVETDEIDDQRAFFYYQDGSDGLLVLASNPSIYARYSSERRRVIADTEGDRWRLHLLQR